ncbi:hypothetical protein [Kitasatospora sp. NPDC058190]|uniref:hypothetical protein n=1 Tax=Kitasatospora sp. NPDC058190 TaxID=3346371 RepID=UPI0036DB09D8
MSWDVVAEEQRVRWTSEPLHGVGPLRFGMTPEEAEEALHGVLELVPWRSGKPHYGPVLSREYNYPHTRDWPAVTAYFSTGRLVAVAIDALRGPQVLLDEIPLVGRAPSRPARFMTSRTDCAGHAGDDGTKPAPGPPTTDEKQVPSRSVVVPGFWRY